MGKSRLFIALLLTITAAFGAKKSSALNLSISETRGAIDATISLDAYDLENITKGGTDYSTITIDGAVYTDEEGAPQLPFKQYNFQLEASTDVSVEVIDAEYTEVAVDNALLPARRTIYRNEDPSTVPFTRGAAYQQDAFYPANVAKLLEPYLIRNARGVTLQVYPVQYNPLTKMARIYSKLELKITQSESAKAINAAPTTTRSLAPSMDNLFGNLFVNYKRWSNALVEEGDMLVIHTSRDADAIKKYVDHKKSYNKFVKNITTKQVATGTNVKQTIKDAYAENSNLLYVQLVGDWADIKSDLGGGANAPMDPMLGCVSGTDKYADIIIGRFSCTGASNLTPQIDKAIAYETNGIQPWMFKAMGIASDEGAGQGDDGEADYDHMDIIKENKLIPNDFTTVHECYKRPSKTTVKNNISDGLGLINYVGHGSHSAWSTSGFSTTDIKTLANAETPVIISVACVNGEFHKGSDCFAEGWLRQKDGGAVATLMATINQPWQPPMRGQDYMNDLITGGYDYSSNPGSGTSTTEGRQTFGSVTFNGMVLMYAEQSGTSDLQTIQTWTIFGDCALDIRPEEQGNEGPTDLTLENNEIDENDTAAHIGEVGVVTDNPGASLSFEIDDDRFEIKNDTLKLKRNKAINYEEEDTVYIVITVTDSDSKSYNEKFAIIINDVNDAPVVSGIEDQTVKEGETFTGIKLSSKVADEDNSHSEIKWTTTTGTYVTVTINTTTATVTVKDENWNGEEEITFTATDPGGLSDKQTVTFKVTPVNDAPVCVNPLEDVLTEGNKKSTLSASDVFEDVDDDILILSATKLNGDELPSWITFDSEEFTFEPTNENLDTFDILVKASDGQDDAVDTFKVSVSEGVAIIMIDGKVSKSSELLFAPNPVPAGATEVTFITPSDLRGQWSVFIYDNMGNLLDEASFNGAGGKTYSWDLRNQAGTLVGSGEYLALIRYTDNKGVLKEYERVIGIQK